VPSEKAGLRPLAKAISPLGGEIYDAVDDGLMLRRTPGCVRLAAERNCWIGKRLLAGI